MSLDPPDPDPCPQALDAVHAADWVVLGPGSWFTSVIPHLLVPALCEAVVRTQARVVVVLNLGEEPGETQGFGPADHLAVLAGHAPDLQIHSVLVDETWAGDGLDDLPQIVDSLGAELVVADVMAEDGSPRHDPTKLAAAYARILGQDHGP